MLKKDNSTGAIGEKFAVKYLKKKKYKIIETNFRAKMGEIDIVASKDKYIVFVEVKTRDENSWFAPVYAVTASKRQKIVKTAQLYLMRKKTDLQPRFDVCTVVTKEKKPILIEHIENAF
ncbi:MAG: YraN family protein [Clostridia bacterium]